MKNSNIKRIEKLKSKFSEVDTFLNKVLNNLKTFGDSWHLVVDNMTKWSRLHVRILIYDLKKIDCNVDAENIIDAYNELVEAIEAYNDASQVVKVSNSVIAFLHVLNEAQQSLTRKTIGIPERQTQRDKALEGEWSNPMTKLAMMSRVGIYGYKKFNTFIKQYKLRQAGNRQLWQIRLDGMDINTRRKFEKA